MAQQSRRAARRISRRRFLGSAAAIAGAAGVAGVIGCARTKRSSPIAPSPTAAATPLPVGSRGGTLRAFNFNAMVPDTLDPHVTQAGPIVNVHSAIFSKLLRYDDERAGTIVPDVADGMPEQPDALTYVVRLRDGVHFHDTPAFRLAHARTPGRALDASDVKYSIERQLRSGSLRFFRQSLWTNIERIDIQDSRTLTISMKAPVAPFLAFLAGKHSFILPRNLAGPQDRFDDPLSLIGSGPFMLDTFEQQNVVKLVRNPAWFARDDRADIGTGRPFLDGYNAYYSPQEDLFEQVSFEHARSDYASFQEIAALVRERTTNLGDVVLEEADCGAVLGSRLLLDRAPFRDDRIRRAIHLAIDRRALADAIYPPMEAHSSAKLSGPIPPALARWALPQDELEQRPGYRNDASGRDEDLRAAKQLWSAALGGASIGDVHVMFAGVPKGIAAKGQPELQRQLRDALGVNIVPAVDSSGYALMAFAFGRNLDGATSGTVPFTFALDDAGVDLDDAVYAQFHSGQLLNTYRLQDPALDTLLDKSRAEFDSDARHRLGIDIQNYLLRNGNARIENCAPIKRRLSWGYVRNSRPPMSDGSDYELADLWLDSSHPAFAGRPA